ncbi:hypothetical protein K8T06_05365 [bacterium]|nr:hypothetical protein [bacterium]
MNRRIIILIRLLATFGILLSIGCATREDFNRSFIERFVQNDVYTNELKGFTMQWPDEDVWTFRNYPEFDLSFDHIDGRSQFLVLGVTRLLRQEFPDGFDEWLMDRLQAQNIQRLSQEDLSTDDTEKFRIITDCEFTLNFGESFGIQRKTDSLLLKHGRNWIAIIFICPRENYDAKVPLFEEIFKSVTML